MKIKLTPRSSLFLVLIFGSLFLLSDCVFKKEENKKELPNTDMNQFEINKQDAKLLVDITKINLDILEIYKSIENQEAKDDLKKVKAIQLNINESLNQLGMQKLIMLPDVFLNPIQYNSIDIQGVINWKISVDSVIYKIKQQIKLFENLEQNTTDVDIKILAIQSKTKLELSLLQLEYTQTNTNI